MSTVTNEELGLRVEVAKEVLVQMGRTDHPIIPERGAYLDVPMMGRDDPAYLRYQGELQPLVEEYQSRGCRSCALGSLLLAKARLFNNAKLSMEIVNGFKDEDDENVDMTHEAYLYRAQLIDCLRDIFDNDTLDAIESFFEAANRSSRPRELEAGRIGGREEYRTAENSLRAICENIIRNGGEFIPQ